MKVRALKCFSGVISMYEGEVRELPDDETVRELIGCGYLEMEDDKKKKPKGGKKDDT